MRRQNVDLRLRSDRVYRTDVVDSLFFADRMLLTHRKLLQSKAIAIDNDLRGTLSLFRIERVVDRAFGCRHRSIPGVRCTPFYHGFGLNRPLPKAALDTLDYPVLDAAVLHAQPPF
jgi:hypothetical protein